VMGMLRGFVVAVESVVQRTWVRCGASCGELYASCACVDPVGSDMSSSTVSRDSVAAHSGVLVDTVGVVTPSAFQRSTVVVGLEAEGSEGVSWHDAVDAPPAVLLVRELDACVSAQQGAIPMENVTVAGVQQPAAQPVTDSAQTRKCTSEPPSTVFDQQVLEMAQLAVHNAVNVCECGAHIELFEVSDLLFDDEICKMGLVEVIEVLEMVEVQCQCEDAAGEIKAAQMAVSFLLCPGNSVRSGPSTTEVNAKEPAAVAATTIKQQHGGAGLSNQCTIKPVDVVSGGGNEEVDIIKEPAAAAAAVKQQHGKAGLPLGVW
jgi:hypothetical protein